MTIQELETRSSILNLEALSRIAVGQPFVGRIKFPSGNLKPYLFIKPEMQRGDDYLFLTLPLDEGIHQVEVAGRDIVFFDAKNEAIKKRPIQPLFDHQKARINTYSPTDNWFGFYQKLVAQSLKRYHSALSQLRTPQPIAG